jgi:hypothetical protein
MRRMRPTSPNRCCPHRQPARRSYAQGKGITQYKVVGGQPFRRKTEKGGGFTSWWPRTKALGFSWATKFTDLSSFEKSTWIKP